MTGADNTIDTLAVPLSPQDISRIFRRTHGGSLNPNDWEFADQLQRECMLRMGVATLRDHFAAKALPGLLGRVWSDPVTGKVPDNVHELWAEGAYATADAMLKERAK